MSKEENGGAAFPTSPVYTENHGLVYGNDGLSMRDYFAAKAMQRLITPKFRGIEDNYVKNIIITPEMKSAAKTAYGIADAMLEARKQ